MGKIKYSALVQEMRNKLNGSVASKNRYGNYFRNKTTPVNPQTSFQQNQRARLSSVSQAWGGLTDAQRQSFATLAQNHPFRDIFGDTMTYDGKAMFSKVNLNLLTAGQALISSAVPFVEVPFVAVDGVTATVADGATVELSVQTAPVGFTVIVECTPPLPATVNFVKNRYRSLGAQSVATGEIDLQSAYATRFGAPTSADVGKRIHVRVFLVSNTTGQVSIASEGSAIIA